MRKVIIREGGRGKEITGRERDAEGGRVAAREGGRRQGRERRREGIWWEERI